MDKWFPVSHPTDIWSVVLINIQDHSTNKKKLQHILVSLLLQVDYGYHYQDFHQTILWNPKQNYQSKQSQILQHQFCNLQSKKEIQPVSQQSHWFPYFVLLQVLPSDLLLFPKKNKHPN